MKSGKTLFVINRILLVFFVIILLFLIHTTTQGWNDRSRLATIEQLVDNHTLVINKASFQTGDKVSINGHFYSDKPPLFSIISSLPYFFLHSFGCSFVSCGSFLIYFTTLFSATLPFIFYFFILYTLISKFTTLSKEKNILFITALSIGTAMFPYATILNNHLLAGILCGLAALLLFFKDQLNKPFLFLVGLLFGFAITIDPASLFITFCFSVYVLYFLFISKYRINSPRLVAIQYLLPIIYYLFGIIIPIFLHWLISIQITGDIFPASMHPEFFNYPGSVFSSNNLTNAGLAVNSFVGWLGYLWLMLFSSRGFLLHNPILIFAIVGTVYLITKSSTKKRIFYLLSLLSFILIVLYYSLYGQAAGGPAYTVRWLIITAPLFVPALVELAVIGKKWFYIFIIVLCFITAIWNIPASGVVFSNINKHPGLNAVNAVRLFPQYLVSQVGNWRKILNSE